MHATNQKGIQHYKSGVDPVRQFAPMLLNLLLAQPASTHTTANQSCQNSLLFFRPVFEKEQMG